MIDCVKRASFQQLLALLIFWQIGIDRLKVKK